MDHNAVQIIQQSSKCSTMYGSEYSMSIEQNKVENVVE